MNTALGDVIRQRKAFRQQVPDLGPGAWLAKLYPGLKGATTELMRGRPGRARARELLVAVGALALLAVESIDAESRTERERAQERARCA